MPKKKKSKYSSSWGLVLSLFLHGIVIIFISFWGIKKYNQHQLSQPIDVSLSSLDYRGSSDFFSNKPKAVIKAKEKTESVKKSESSPKIKKEEKKVEKSPEPENKQQPKEEPKKVEIKKEEVVKKEPEKPKKDVVPLEAKKAAKKPEKKIEKKKEAPKKKEEKKIEPKKAEKPKQNLELARSDVLNDLKRKAIIESLKSDESPVQSDSVEDSNISTGSGLKGKDSSDVAGGSRLNPALLNVYKNAIWRRIKPRFKIPPNIPRDGSLTASIFFKMDDQGNVSGVEVKESSGNSAFDNFCINTVLSSSPLPPPPSEISSMVISQGFEIPMNNES